MIYQFKHRGKLKISCGEARKEEAHSYMRNKIGKGKYKVFAIESTVAEEIKESIEFKKFQDMLSTNK